MTTHPFKLIIFDMDGTLIDGQHHIQDAMREAFGGLGLALPDPAAVRAIVGLTLEDAFARLHPEPESAAQHQELMERFKHAAFAQRRQPGYSEPLYERVREVIALLDEPEVCLGIATGRARRGVDFSLELHGMAHHFVTIQTVDNNPGKPHPGMIERAMSEVGAAPQETVMIGDTSFDMMMARSAGARALGVTWGYHSPEELLEGGAEVLAESFSEIPGHLPRLWRNEPCG
jgi:phosphoglycolate phosphatase